MIRQTASAAALAAFVTLTAGCMTPPTQLDLSTEKASAAGTYQVAVLPPAPAAAINQMHSWKVKVASADGAPVRGARMTVDGGMPQHGHGLPTQPRITRELEAGTYLLEGMKFSMPGWWELKLEIQAPQGTDQVIFNTVVAPAGGRL